MPAYRNNGTQFVLTNGLVHDILSRQIGIGITVLCKSPVGTVNYRRFADIFSCKFRIPAFYIGVVVLPGQDILSRDTIEELQQRPCLRGSIRGNGAHGILLRSGDVGAQKKYRDKEKYDVMAGFHFQALFMLSE
jgi:hypothetical protein